MTRPRESAQALYQLITAAGGVAACLPTTGIEPIIVSAVERQHIVNVDAYACVIVLSQHAARLMCDALDDHWPQWPIGIEWLAVGESTQAVLVTHGIDANRPLAEETTEGILNYLKQHSSYAQWCREGRPILLVKGQGGRPDLEQALKTAQFQVDTLHMYKRTCVTYTEEEVGLVVETMPDALLFTSVEVAHNLLTILQTHKQDVSAYFKLPSFVPSERVKHALIKCGFVNVMNVGSARNDEMLKAVDAYFVNPIV